MKDQKVTILSWLPEKPQLLPNEMSHIAGISSVMPSPFSSFPKNHKKSTKKKIQNTSLLGNSTRLFLRFSGNQAELKQREMG